MLMTSWGWFTTITAIIIPKMVGGLAEILPMNRVDGIFISSSRTIHACTLIRLAFLKILKRNVARMV